MWLSTFPGTATTSANLVGFALLSPKPPFEVPVCKHKRHGNGTVFFGKPRCRGCKPDNCDECVELKQRPSDPSTPPSSRIQEAQMKAATYARFSSDAQSASSIEGQRRNCRRRGEADGWQRRGSPKRSAMRSVSATQAATTCANFSRANSSAIAAWSARSSFT
jgi:hypothetical protein